MRNPQPQLLLWISLLSTGKRCRLWKIFKLQLFPMRKSWKAGSFGWWRSRLLASSFLSVKRKRKISMYTLYTYTYVCIAKVGNPRGATFGSERSVLELFSRFLCPFSLLPHNGTHFRIFSFSSCPVRLFSSSDPCHNASNSRYLHSPLFFPIFSSFSSPARCI